MSQPKPRPAQRTESLNAFSRRNFLSSSALMGAGLILGSLPDRAHAMSSEPRFTDNADAKTWSYGGFRTGCRMYEYQR